MHVENSEAPRDFVVTLNFLFSFARRVPSGFLIVLTNSVRIVTGHPPSSRPGAAAARPPQRSSLEDFLKEVHCTVE